MLALHLAFLALIVGAEALFAVLDVVNLRHGERTLAERATWVAETLDLEDTDEIVDYTRASTAIDRLASVVTLGAVLLVLYGGVFADLVVAVESLGLPDVAAGTLFVVGAMLALEVLSWPFDVVDTFVVEEMFGFNEQTPRLWVRDALLGLAVAAVINGLLVAALLWVIATVPGLWALGGAALFLAFALVMQVVKPRVIDPLFNDFEPVEAGDLRDAVEDVFDRAGFTCEQVYEMDASRRSSHSNAYFVGFGRTKRVVLFDTLVDQMALEELQSILAHELAHWKKHHVWTLLAASTVRVGVLLGVAQLLMGQAWLYGMFGVPETTYAGLLLALLWVLPLARLTQPLANRLSLAHEREADRFAVAVMGEDGAMASALANLVGENLGNPFPHPWYAAFHYRHPPVPDRIRYIEELTSGDAGGDDAAASDG